MKKIIILVLSITLYGNVFSQQFISATNTFSHQKTAYITLADGSEIEGSIDNINRKKGLIEFIKLIDANGKAYNLKSEEIQHMYLPPTNFDHLQKSARVIGDVQKWNDEKLNQDILNNGYAYFELAEVKLKTENKKLLMQLLNPSFSKKLKVYYDPFASTTSSFSIGDLSLVGGIAKSYYVSSEDNIAFKLSKKSYDKEFKTFFKNFNLLQEKYPDPNWRDLPEHIIIFSDCSEKH